MHKIVDLNEVLNLISFNYVQKSIFFESAESSIGGFCIFSVKIY